MRNTQWIIALFLTISLSIGSAMAADAEKQAPANEASKLETISGTPATDSVVDDKCPMHKGKKNYKEKHGEPCPYQDKGHHDKLHDKCEHEHRSDT
jgi:hypothetical protein